MEQLRQFGLQEEQVPFEEKVELGHEEEQVPFDREKEVLVH